MKRLPTGLALAFAAMAIGCHSTPFETPADGAIGPLAPQAEARLTFNTGDQYGHPFSAFPPSWAQGGGGILYTFSPRPHQIGESLALDCVGSGSCHLASRDSVDRCLALLPPQGGSAYWQMCDTRPFHTDSVDIFASAAVSSSGQALYIEMSGPTVFPSGSPLGLHAELWLGTAGSFVPRQKLLTLYHDHLGIDQTDAGSVNWLSEMTWLGNSTFLAVGGHLFPADSLRPRGLVIGVIGAVDATISVVPGTASDSISHFGLIGGGSAVLIVDSTAVIRRVDLQTGGALVVATLPLSITGRSLDIGCRPDACVVLTRDGSPVHWDLWKLDVASSALTLTRTFTHALTAAKLSPVTGDVVALEGANLYYLPKVLQ